MANKKEEEEKREPPPQSGNHNDSPGSWNWGWLLPAWSPRQAAALQQPHRLRVQRPVLAGRKPRLRRWRRRPEASGGNGLKFLAAATKKQKTGSPTWNSRPGKWKPGPEPAETAPSDRLILSHTHFSFLAWDVERKTTCGLPQLFHVEPQHICAAIEVLHFLRTPQAAIAAQLLQRRPVSSVKLL